MLSVSAHSVGVLAFCTSTATSSAAKAGAANAANTMASAALRTRRIDVPGIGTRRQRRKPAADRVNALPVVMHHLLALAQRRIVARGTERDATGEAGLRDIALNRGEFERQRRNRLCQSAERFGLEALDVNLHEGRRAVFRDQRIQRRHADRDALVPVLTFPAGRAFGGSEEVLRRGR